MRSSRDCLFRVKPQSQQPKIPKRLVQQLRAWGFEPMIDETIEAYRLLSNELWIFGAKRFDVASAIQSDDALMQARPPQAGSSITKVVACARRC
jgi:hypothetical protein